MIGRRLGHYEISEKLGEGGMGVVWKARDTHLDRFVALKTLPAEKWANPERRRRFVQEAKAASALNHPNIVHVYDIADADRVPFIAMEYVQGKTLDQLIVRKALAQHEALRYAAQMADALAKAHSAGIIHRDLKPSNIMVTDEGLVKLLDFGLAKLTQSAAHVDLVSTCTIEANEAPRTEAGVIMGTVAYMSPEQAEGRPIDARSDIFSFGSVLYELITGQPAFQGRSSVAILAAVIGKEPKPLHEIVHELPAELDKVVSRCLRKDPNRRFQHALDLKLELEELLPGLRSTAARPSSIKTEAEARPNETIPSIAVLPFVDMSAQRDQEYFCEGIAEEIINALTQIDGLRVASRTSSFRFKGKAEDVSEIGRQLGVKTVLEGSVRSAGGRLRIAVQLIDVSNGFHLWSVCCDKKMEDVFAIQEEIANAIVTTQKVKFASGEKVQLLKRYTENPEAYECYLHGRYYWNKRVELDLRKAVDYFEKAIRKDPNYSVAYAGLADSYALLGIAEYGVSPPKEVMPKAKSAATKALEIDNTCAEAQTQLAHVTAFYEWNWDEADKEFRRAVELDQSYPFSHHWYALYLAAMGRFDEAIMQEKRAQELDPLSLIINKNVGTIYYYARQHERAIEQYKKTLELAPDFPRSHFFLGLAYLATSMFEEAVLAFQKAIRAAGENGVLMGALGHAYARSGKMHEAGQVLRELKKQMQHQYVPSFNLVMIYAGLGMNDDAFESMEQAFEERSSWLVSLKVEPLFDSLRSDSRYSLFLNRVGLAE